MSPLSQDTKDQREGARKALAAIASNARASHEERTAAAAILLQDIAIEENT